MNVSNGISHADLTVQQVDDIERRIKMDVLQEHPDFEEVFLDKPWPKNKESVKYRTLVHQPITKDEIDSFQLKEFTAPTSRGLKYANFSEHTKSYGTDYEYSWEDVEGNADDIVVDIKDELKGWTIEMLTFIYGKALLSTKSTMAQIGSSAAAGSLLKAFRRARKIFTKLGIKKWSAGQWLCYLPVDLSDALSEEHIAAYGGKDIPSNVAMQDINGYIGNFKGFTLKNPAQYGEQILIEETAGTVTGYYMVFVGKTPTGRQPGERFHKEGEDGIELILNPLGTGVVQDGNGKVKHDNNKQKGSVAENLKYVSAHILDDRAILKIFVSASYISNLDISGDMANINDNLEDVIKAKDSAKGAYAETYGAVTEDVAVSPLALNVDEGTVAASSTLTLVANMDCSGVTSSNTSVATVSLGSDKRTITVTGVAAGEVEIEAVDLKGINSDVAFITVTAA